MTVAAPTRYYALGYPPGTYEEDEHGLTITGSTPTIVDCRSLPSVRRAMEKMRRTGHRAVSPWERVDVRLVRDWPDEWYEWKDRELDDAEWMPRSAAGRETKEETTK